MECFRTSGSVSIIAEPGAEKQSFWPKKLPIYWKPGFAHRANKFWPFPLKLTQQKISLTGLSYVALRN